MRRLVIVLLFIAVLSLPVLLFLRESGDGGGGERVALIDSSGGIADTGGDGGSGDPRTIVGFLRQAETDPRVKAVVVRINSGGGSPAAAEEIYDAIRRIRSRGKPVVASMGDVAASAAYYIAAAADRIVANPSTTTGSIGVISQNFVIGRLLDELGITVETVVSGPFKDATSQFRPMTEEERAYMQALVNDVLEQFVHAVAEGRGLDVEYVRSLADGRIFTGRQAHSLRLVDELGGLEDAIMLAGRLAGIPGRPRVITLRRQPTLSERLLQLYLPALDGLIDPSHGDVIRWLGVPPWGYRLR